mmetsp:Transcript_18853/g.28085  ORF Transcript_18853/g.28085 Transcript_18853/m.28085 type:complete len:234 (+) Transcript_18853:117-818(+)
MSSSEVLPAAGAVQHRQTETSENRARLVSGEFLQSLGLCKDFSFIDLLDTMIQQSIQTFDGKDQSMPEEVRNLSFFAPTMPSIGLREYVERIMRYSPCSPECYVVALVYLKRIIKKNSPAFFCRHTAHRLLITAVLVASKYMDDLYYNNRYYAKVGGISASEMNNLEIRFLFLLDFKLNVSTRTFSTQIEYLHAIVDSAPRRSHYKVPTTRSAPSVLQQKTKSDCNHTIVSSS